MKTLLLSLLLFCSAGLATAQLPPLIDREVFFGNPEYAGAQISPDGKYVAFVKPLTGTMNVWVKGVDEPFSAARPMTNDQKRPVRSYFWSRDGKYILFVQDNGGDENFNVYAVNPSDKAADGSPVPTARNITAGKKVRAIIQTTPASDPDAIYVGLNERDPAWHDLYKVKISTGDKTLLVENKDRLASYVFDNADKLRMATRSAPSGETELLRVNADGTTAKIYSCDVFESCGPVGFTKDNAKALIQTNKGTDLIELDTLDLATGKTEKIEADPLGKVDQGNVSISDRTHEIIATAYEDDRVRIVWHDKEYKKDYDFIKSKLGDREVDFTSNTTDETKFTVSTHSDVDPGTIWLYDRKSHNLTTLYQVREGLDRKALSPMTSIKYPSSDGMEIPAYLTIPKGSSGKNLPLVVFPHGGPWGRDSWGYSTFAQFLANRGYAVLSPNFRASTGYGKKFLNAGNNEWGQKMQDDLTWGVKYLIAQGVADPKRVGIMGGSYGGYATLAGVAFTPDVYAAGVAIVAPSNLKTLLESVPPYWESIRTIFYKRMGDPNTSEGLAQMKRQSPLFSADKIKTPLMVVQGANDPRVNKREADQIVIALRDRNYPVEYLVAPDEGHGFARPVNNSAMVAAAEKFLAKHLGGRYQETATPEVTKRLAEITVDPKTVVLAQVADMSAAPVANVTGKWMWTVDAGGQQIPLDINLKQDAGAFTGTSSSPLGQGTIVDGKVSGSAFTALLKADMQGQAVDIKIEGKIDGGKISGSMNVPGFGILPFVGVKN
ncbi:MAG TPA: S9 family peptidase [Pyrinomonadaceae bacterium]|nr:S9 family peptidase [Pyrinomonadaceae bacterium]